MSATLSRSRVCEAAKAEAFWTKVAEQVGILLADRRLVAYEDPEESESSGVGTLLNQ